MSGSRPIVRMACAADKDSVLQMATAMAVTFQVDAIEFDRIFDEIIGLTSVALYVADDNGVVIGYLLGSTCPTFYANGPTSTVAEIFVAESHRKTGVGLQLMSAFEKWSAGKSSRLVAVATRRAGPFYQAIGYENSASYYVKQLAVDG